MKPNILELILGKLAEKGKVAAAVQDAGLPDLDAIPLDVDTGKPEDLPVEAGLPDFFNDMGLPSFAVAEGYTSEDDEEEDEDADGHEELDATPPEVDAGTPDGLPIEIDGGPPEDLPPLDAGKPEGLPPGEDFFDPETGLPTFLVAEGFPGDREDDEVEDPMEDVDF